MDKNIYKWYTILINNLFDIHLLKVKKIIK